MCIRDSGHEVWKEGEQSFYLDSMIAYKSDQANDWEATDSDGGSAFNNGTSSIRQFNVQEMCIRDSRSGARGRPG